jgi:hypothetical protein
MPTPGVDNDATGFMIRGYDPVAYFTERQEGSKCHKKKS